MRSESLCLATCITLMTGQTAIVEHVFTEMLERWRLLSSVLGVGRSQG